MSHESIEIALKENIPHIHLRQIESNMNLRLHITALKASMALAIFLPAFSTLGQTPSDGVMMKKGEFCGGIFYNHGAWDQYWEADSLLTNGNIGTLTIQTVSAGFVLGITDFLNVYASLPYVTTSPSAGFVEGTSGIQDAGLYAKVRALNTEVGPGKLYLFASAGAGIPASDYIPEHPFAIGNGCLYGVGRLILTYDSDLGVYARVGSGYHVRGNSEIVRGYYFTTEGYMSTEIDMPNALDYNAAVGYYTENNMFKIEAEYTNFNTQGGFDMRYWDMMFPSNNRDFSSLGGSFQYIPNWGKGLGVHLSTSAILQGRNMPKTFNYGAGITYFFKAWNKGTEAAQ